MTEVESAQAAYDRLAPVYDEFNAQNDYELWLGATLLPELEKHGLRRGWALDVGCGTGRAFEPLLKRGWSIVGSDVSAGMLAEAERKFGSRVFLHHIDACELPAVFPRFGIPCGSSFDLILLLNDVLNCQTEDGDLERLFASVAANLNREHGLAVFDASTLLVYRTIYAAEAPERMNSRGMKWRGLTEEARPGGVHEARLSGPTVESHVHRQRHWLAHEIRSALEVNGLRCIAILGQTEGEGEILLSDPPDEDTEFKVIYVVGF
ncbi:MAG: class I SAM-dependent DNA methyltransferase [Solirubrobacterales bacterium]